MKTINLTQEKVALVDDGDYEWVNQFKWYAKYMSSVRSYYAVRIDHNGGHRRGISMARFIMDAPPGLQVDHRNHDTLDNQRDNLRLATRSQNNGNTRKRRNNTSGYKGVSFHQRLTTNPWQARIEFNWKNIHLEYFPTAIQAAKMYDFWARELFGEFCLTNFNAEIMIKE